MQQETQTSSLEITIKHSRIGETNETRNLSTRELKRLILLEQLSLIRIQKAKYLCVNVSRYQL